MRNLWFWFGWVVMAFFLLLLLAGLGVFWLCQQGLFYPFAGIALAVLCASGLAGLWLNKQQVSHFSKFPEFQPERLVSPAAEEAWAVVEKIAESLSSSDYPLSDPAQLMSLARRIISQVAKQFNQSSEAAEMEVPLPSILLMIERVSHDMRELLTSQVPASHLISIQDGLVLWRWKEKLKSLGVLGDISWMLASPISAIMQKSRMALFKRVVRYPLGDLEKWLLQSLARRLGHYAILLYSGELWMSPSQHGSIGPQSVKDLKNADALQQGQLEEPLRILVAGQTKAGKSSLINALFGQLQSPIDVLPSTRLLLPYRLEQEGELLGIIFDSPGYGDHVTWVEENLAELQMVDLVLLVCSAVQAGRAADRQFLESLRILYAKTPDRVPPPVIVVLTHIDLLRPSREWNPPYNFEQALSSKESQIRLCMEHVAETLFIPLEQVQAVCFKSGDEWNIEAVWAVIASQLPQARRSRYLRCLKDGFERERWELILRQLGNAGRMMVGGIKKALPGK